MSLLFVGHPNERDLALFTGGELGPLARWRIEKHLQNCSRCEEMVADFFHLQGELGELAELPPVDWSAQARAILERAEQQPAASTQRGFGGLFSQPLALRAGLAMAAVLCAVVVIRQFPEQEKTARPEFAVVAENLSASKQTEEPASEPAQAEVDGAEALQPLELPGPTESAALSDSSRADSIAPDLNRADSNRTEGNEAESKEEFRAAQPAKRERDQVGAELEARADHQVGRQVVLAPDVAAPASAQGLRKAPAITPSVAAEGARQEGFAFGGARRSAATQEKAAANKSASAPGAPPTQLSAAGERSNTEIAVVGQATEERVLLDRAADLATSKDKDEAAANTPRPEQQAQASLRTSAANEPQRASSSVYSAGGAAPAMKARFAILPSTPGAQTEMGVAADGAISFRSVDAASGTITITHVYQP
jgi:hypothetical protein